MVIKRFPLQCGSHLPQCPQLNKLPSHPPPGNPFDFNLDHVGKSCLPAESCISSSIYGQNERPNYNRNIFNELKDARSLLATVSWKGLNLFLFHWQGRLHPASVPETVTLAHTMTMSNKWMNYWPCTGDTRQASPRVFPKASCWVEARPLFQW